jgi:hypothetical protein
MTQTIAQQIKWDFKTNGLLEIRDKNGRAIYVENSMGVWSKHEYDSKGNEIYWENSVGGIVDNRPKPCEGKIVEFGGEKFKLVKV